METNDKMTSLQLDGNKMIHHMDRVSNWLKGGETFPIYVAFSPSSLCNHACHFCVYHYKEFEPIYFPLKRYETLINEFKKLNVKSMFFAGDGEPLLNKNCLDMVSLTKSSNIDIAMNTNGRLLNKQAAKVLARDLSWIRFSVNAGTASTYGNVHQTNPKDFDIVLSNIENLVYEKKKINSDIVIGVQCVLLNENKDEIEKLAKKIKSIGADYLSIKPFLKHPQTTWTTELNNKEKVLQELQELKLLNNKNFQFLLRVNNFSPSQRSYCKCLSGDFMIEIDARGDVYSCGPYIGNEEHRYGNIINQTFLNMWRSPECRNKIKSIQENLDVNKCMPFCRPDSVNKFLWQLKNPPKHVNFI